MAGLLLAGCTSPPASDPTLDPSLRGAGDEPVAPQGTPPPKPPRPTEPPTGGAPAEPPETEATRWVKAQWGHAEVLPLLDQNVTLATDPEAPVLVSCFLECAYAFVTPAAGRLVPPGASEVEVVLTFPGNGSLGAQYREQGQVEYRSVASGEAFNISLAEDETDLPFEGRSSFWLFLIDFSTSYRAGLAQPPTVHVQAQVRRGAELPTFGPAPDPWGGQQRLLLVNETHAQFVVSAPLLFGCFLGCDVFWDVQPGTIVGPGADTVRVAFSWESLLPTAEAPVLYYWSGGTGGRLSPGDAGRSFTVDLKVPPEETDSPYRNESRWFFYVDLPDVADSDHRVWEGQITLAAEVTRR